MIAVLVSACWNMGCEQDRTINLPPHQPRLVLHGYMETGDSVKVTVGRTFSVNVSTVSDSTYVKNALVILYVNDVVSDTLSYQASSRKYTSSRVKAVPGKIYKVIVKAPGFETVEAVTPSPFPVNALSVAHIRNTRVSVAGTALDDIIFRFSDPAAENNFYLAELRGGYMHQNYFCVYSYDPVIENYQADVDPFEVNSCIDNDEILYGDQAFNGSTREIILSAGSGNLEIFTDQTTGKIYKPFLKRYTITENYYRYIKSMASLNLTYDNPFAQPVSVKGNVKNGYGIFTILAPATDTLQ